MDFELPEEIKMIQSTIRKVVQEELMPLEKVVMDVDKQGIGAEFPEDIRLRLRKRAIDLGIFASEMPKEFGGPGLSILARMVVGHELAYTVAPMPTTVGTGTTILIGANPEIREKWMPRLLRGEIRSCFCQTEPGAGADVAGIKTTAVKEGDEWVINGHKMFASGADRADVAFIVAVTDKAKGTHGGISTFVVDTHQPGFKVLRKVYTMGGGYSTELHLENVRTPANTMVGEQGRGFAQASRFLSGGRLGMGASFIGYMRRSLDMSIDYAKKRVTFGEPLSNRQAIQWMLVDGAIAHHASQLMLYHACWITDERPERDNRNETSMVRVFASEHGLKVIDNAIQIHGGLGYSKDLPLELMYRRARLYTIGEGPNEIQRYIIARNIFRG